MLKAAVERENGRNTKYMFGGKTIIKNNLVQILADGNMTVEDIIEQAKKFFKDGKMQFQDVRQNFSSMSSLLKWGRNARIHRYK